MKRNLYSWTVNNFSIMYYVLVIIGFYTLLIQFILVPYSLTAPGDPSDLDYFDIQPESGWIYLTRPLDVSFLFIFFFLTWNWCWIVVSIYYLGIATAGAFKNVFLLPLLHIYFLQLHRIIKKRSNFFLRPLYFFLLYTNIA